jgi:beta-glucosidase-like glycosyl hydrolase
MEGYHEVGGIPVASSSLYLQDLIRDQMGFEGMLVTDYREILNLYEFHKVAASSIDAVELSLKETSIDMSMVPQDTSFYEDTLQLVQSGKISHSRIDESARRVLELKNTLGLFDTPIPPQSDPLVDTVGQDADWELSLETARESMTLLKNEDSTLPFPNSEEEFSVFVTGPTCDSLVRQTGGWSLHWQGGQTDSEFPRGVTIKQGLQAVYGDAKVWQTLFPLPLCHVHLPCLSRWCTKQGLRSLPIHSMKSMSTLPSLLPTLPNSLLSVLERRPTLRSLATLMTSILRRAKWRYDSLPHPPTA